MTEVSSGLEGVVAFETVIAEPDREGGALRGVLPEPLPWLRAHAPSRARRHRPHTPPQAPPSASPPGRATGSSATRVPRNSTRSAASGLSGASTAYSAIAVSRLVRPRRRTTCDRGDRAALSVC